MHEFGPSSIPMPSPEDLEAYEKLKTAFDQAFVDHAKYIIEDPSSRDGRMLLLAPYESFETGDRTVLIHLIQLNASSMPEFMGSIMLMVNDKVDELIIDYAGLVWDRFIDYEAHGLGIEDVKQLDPEEREARKQEAKENLDLSATVNPPALAKADLINLLEGWITHAAPINQGPETSD